MENDGNPRKIDSKVFPQPSDHAQPRHNVFVEQQSCAFASARLDQSAINEGLNDRGMKALAFGKPFERQPLILWPAKKLSRIALQSSVGHQLPRIKARLISKLLEEFSLRGAQTRRVDDLQLGVLIAAPTVSAIQALPTQSQPLARLCSGRHRHFDRTFERRYRDPGAEGRFPGRHRHLELHVVITGNVE
jgi:hypothetical protein